MTLSTPTLIAALYSLSEHIENEQSQVKACIKDGAERLAMLFDAIYLTLTENLHLADGDVCTLKRLKDAINFEPIPEIPWPRVRDLPESEREAFELYLGVEGIARPLLEGLEMDDQDGFYPEDYSCWKMENKPLNWN
jgi:hypothetical protein